MIALLEAYREGLLQPQNLVKNASAGLIVGIVALPLAMAFAIASGVSPAQGIYTAIVSGAVVGIFGGSRVQIAGPTGAFVVILSGITARFGVEGLQVATLLAGLMLLMMGVMKFGNVIKFIPVSVIVGFTSGIGVIIFFSEWNDFFGLSLQLPPESAFSVKMLALIQALPHLDIATTAMALFCLMLMWLTPKCVKNIPGPLVAMLVATALQAHFHFKTVATIGSTFGGIPSALPTFQPLALNWPLVYSLLGPAFTIALLGAIESLLSASAADGLMKTRHDSNQELIGQGLANVLAPLFGGFAATGAIARTATNVRQGGNSPVAAIVHSLFLLLVVWVLAPLAKHIPLSALAAILFVVAYNMSDIAHFRYMLLHAPRSDVLVLVTTFFLTVFTNLVIAVNVGVLLAILLFMRRMVEAVTVEKARPEAFNEELAPLPPDTLVYTIEGPFFFGAAEKIERALAVTHTDPKAIIFRLKNVPFIDMTGLQTLREILEAFHHRGVQVYLCEANHTVRQHLEKTGIHQWIAKSHVFENCAGLLEALQSPTPTPLVNHQDNHHDTTAELSRV
ncbi:STAS domain-containing protein [Legionella geestiana]|uniref:SulP family inorganic anion transporter n=1 Tax=Legionella geestiana TaxID=45065 RepID=UPI001091C9CE|nr:SulP family inorganic anion transporter [Legionella geestiana]QDQ39518.1 STAS domain-containing protein [Legionella geestiana]